MLCRVLSGATPGQSNQILIEEEMKKCNIKINSQEKNKNKGSDNNGARISFQEHQQQAEMDADIICRQTY